MRGQGGSLKSRRVLIVEDDHDTAAAMRFLLENRGYHVDVAYNGREALEHLAASEQRPCLILLDLIMPIMDGFQFLEARKRDPRIAQAPVVVVTATDMALDAGEHVILRKPVDFAALIRNIEKACGPTPGTSPL